MVARATNSNHGQTVMHVQCSETINHLIMVLRPQNMSQTSNSVSQICWLHTEWHIGVINPSYLEWTTNNKKSKPLIKL